MPKSHSFISISPITFVCDLRAAKSRIIPLGAIGEFAAGKVRSMGLIARTSLTEDEISCLGTLIRERLLNPFEFLKQEFNWAWENTAPGEALVALAERHNTSLNFGAPTLQALTPETVKALAAEPMKATERVTKRRNKAFVEMLGSKPKPALSDIQELAKLNAHIVPVRIRSHRLAA